MLKRLKQLPEDWIATGIGLLIVLIIGTGLLGPGAQSATLKAQAGESAQAALLALDGWQIGSEGAAAPSNPVSALVAGAAYQYQCADGQIMAQQLDALPDGINPPDAGKALVLLSNQCEQAITLTYRRDAALRWPLFGLLGR